MSKTKLFLMMACAVLMLSAFAAADTPGAHPAYLHALTDLRHARAQLDIGTPDYRLNDDERHAIGAIDAAIGDVKEAAIDDGKPLSDHPHVDAGTNRVDRLRRAVELLDSAYNDIDKREANDFARDLKHRALHHIDEARHAVHHAIEERRW